MTKPHINQKIAGGSLVGESILSRSMAQLAEFESAKPFGLIV